MTTHHHHEPEKIPPLLLWGSGALIAITLVVTAFSSLTNVGTQKAEASVIIETIAITFEDDDDGGVSVYDHGTRELLWNYPPESGGFVRTAMRAIVHTRKLKGIGPEEPFILSRTENGRLLLSDPQTDRTIGLEAFGAANANDFAQIIDNRGNAG